jgi:hypothetical protein
MSSENRHEVSEPGTYRVPESDPENPEGPSLSLRVDSDEYSLLFSAPVAEAGANRCHIAEPVSVTFLGPHGPMLNLGDLIEVTPLSDGSYGYVRTVERSRVWSETLQGVEQDPRVYLGAAGVLDELVKAGCRWEWCSGNLTVQMILGDGESEPPSEVEELVERLVAALGRSI